VLENKLQTIVAIVGGGPAGLMAAERLILSGVQVHVFDAMPSVGRKFLMAGKGGMNITHAEPYTDFLSRYGVQRDSLSPVLNAFTPTNLREWLAALGIDTFVGSSGRVFPTDMKAAPLLRAWLHRLRQQGVQFHLRHRWLGWNAAGELRFDTPLGEQIFSADALVLALGGGSWPQLGSTAAWLPLLAQRGVDIAPLRPSNGGFELAWSAHFRQRFAGHPLKSIAIQHGERRQLGECMVTEHGLEGGLIYQFSAALRDEIELRGSATLQLDLLPDWSAEKVSAQVAHPRGSRSLSSHLSSRLNLSGVKANLLREILGAHGMANLSLLAESIKALPLKLLASRPLSEAISSAGGVKFSELDSNLMLKKCPGVFVAGEMLDWEAPTGGYLLSACFATGRAAGEGAMNYLEQKKLNIDSLEL
jgi:hypothetical protein